MTMARRARRALRLSPQLLLAFCGVSSAQQPSLPNDGELRSAYCIPILRWEIAGVSKMVASLANSQTPEAQHAYADSRTKLEKFQSALNRLQSYLAPRAAYLDPVSLALAQHRGEADLHRLEDIAQCTTDCEAKKDNKADVVACSEACIDRSLVDRMKACAEPSWLPF